MINTLEKHRVADFGKNQRAAAQDIAKNGRVTRKMRTGSPRFRQEMRADVKKCGKIFAPKDDAFTADEKASHIRKIPNGNGPDLPDMIRIAAAPAAGHVIRRTYDTAA